MESKENVEGEKEEESKEKRRKTIEKIGNKRESMYKREKEKDKRIKGRKEK